MPRELKYFLLSFILLTTITIPTSFFLLRFHMSSNVTVICAMILSLIIMNLIGLIYFYTKDKIEGVDD